MAQIGPPRVRCQGGHESLAGALCVGGGSAPGRSLRRLPVGNVSYNAFLMPAKWIGSGIVCPHSRLCPSIVRWRVQIWIAVVGFGVGLLVTRRAFGSGPALCSDCRVQT